MSYFETTSPSSLFLSSLSLSHFSSSIRSSQLLFSTNYNSTLPTTTHLLFLPSLTDFYTHYNHSQPLTFFHQLQISTNTIDRFIAMKRPYVQSYTNSSITQQTHQTITCIQYKLTSLMVDLLVENKLLILQSVTITTTTQTRTRTDTIQPFTRSKQFNHLFLLNN